MICCNNDVYKYKWRYMDFKMMIAILSDDKIAV